MTSCVASSERSGTPGAPSLPPKLAVSPPPRNSVMALTLMPLLPWPLLVVGLVVVVVVVAPHHHHCQTLSWHSCQVGDSLAGLALTWLSWGTGSPSTGSHTSSKKMKLNSQSSHLRKLSMNKAKWGFVKTSYGAWRPASCHAFMRFKTMPSQASPDLT